MRKMILFLFIIKIGSDSTDSSIYITNLWISSMKPLIFSPVFAPDDEYETD